MNAPARRLAVFASLLALVAVAAPPAHAAKKPKKADFRLTLLHNNDGESKLQTGDSRPDYGGAARFTTVVNDLRAQARTADVPRRVKKGTLMLSSGDNFLAGLALLAGFDSGPPWPDAIVANALRYDAMTLGNHEFDFGQARLAEFIEGVDDDIPFISANLGFEDTIPELADLAGERLRRSVVVERRGVKIGVIGLTTPDIATISSPGNVEIKSNLAGIVNGEVRALRERKVKVIIVSAHLQGIAADEAVIPDVRGVDVWIAGGGDDLLANPDDVLIEGDSSVGTYPKAVEGKAGDDVLVVSTAGEYKYVGRLTAQFSKEGRVKRVLLGRSGPVRVSGNVADEDFAEEDPFVKENAVDPVIEFSAELASQPVGTTEVELRRTTPPNAVNDPIRRRESGFGNVVADSFLWEAQRLAPSVGVDAPLVAIANGGGYRADIPAGPVNRAQTFAALPFFNQVGVVEDVACEQLRQLLERGYSGLPLIEGRFANIAGMRVEVDPAETAQVVTTEPPVTITTPGERVRNLWLDNGTPQDTADDTQLIDDGVAVGGCQAVDLATTNFTANDGDAYPFTAQGLTFTLVGALYNQAFEDYIMAPTTEGGLGGTVTAAQYPEIPVGVKRITIAGE